jgi:hypothetical protein
MHSSNQALRLSRRKMLVLLGGSAAGASLLAATGDAIAEAQAHDRKTVLNGAVAAVLAPPAFAAAQATDHLAGYRQATQSGFSPISSMLTFGSPTDVAAGWDGTVWAIDNQGAPHLHDPLTDTWQLHGTGLDAAVTSLPWLYPAVYFKGSEVLIADGQHSLQPIASVWPQLPKSYQLGVKGAIAVEGHLDFKFLLFRGGTYLTVPAPPPAASAVDEVYHAPLLAAATTTPSATPAPARSATTSPSGVPTNVRPTQPAGTATGAPTQTPTPAATASQTATSTPTSTSAATPTPSPAAASPTATPAPGASPTTDYVARPLNAIPGWPQTSSWQDGIIDGVYGGVFGVFLIRGGEYVQLGFGRTGDSITLSVSEGPSALGNLSAFVPNALPADWQATGFDTGFDVLAAGGQVDHTVITRGAEALVFPRNRSASPELTYMPRAIGDWPTSWHPQLQHAPSGRSSGLWAATVEGNVVSFDGTTWTQQRGDALSVGVGRDGAVFAVGKNNPQQLSQWNGSAFTQVATHSTALSQVSVGAQSQVWTRDSTNAVHQLNQGQLQPVTLVGSAAHIAANYDGTLWSCTGGDPHAQRLASDLNQAPATVAAAGTVQKVASTGFGAAHCLVAQNGATQLYRYDSPYVFRTPGQYVFPKVSPIEQGLGSLFFVTQSSVYATGAPEPKYQVVALDGHTGQELSRSAIAPPGLIYTPPVFDPIHDVLIVGLTVDTYVSDQLVRGQLLGLDARDLTNVRWSIMLPNDGNGDNLPVAVGPGQPTLQGTHLCVSDGQQSLVMYDTGGPDATMPTWRWTQTNLPSGPSQLTPPVIANGHVYAAWWVQAGADQPDAGNLELWIWQLSANDASAAFPMPASFPPDAALSAYWGALGTYSPVLASVPGAQQGQSRQVLFVNGGTSVWGVDVDATTAQSYHLPGSGSTAPFVVSGFAYSNNVLWFGDTSATLYGLDAQNMQPVPNTPATFGPGTIATTPLLYTDAQGEAAVLLSVVNGPEPPGLMVFDPTSGNTISIPTQGTQLVGLGPTATNGVVYAGGGTFSGNSTQLTAQVFAIRVDQAVQELRDFIVDSQLMQDFDDPSQPTHDPSGVARYQTHLTLVDGTRAPLAGTPVKLWADQPNTTVLVNGQSVSLGPEDDQYAVVKTGSDGALVITSGSTQRDSSGTKFVDGADMTAVPLRAWVHFMDPYERMVIYRDREFHNRVSTAHATSPSQAGADDPTRANLQTAQAYGAVQKGGGNTGTALFTDQQKQQSQPQNVANAIQKMTGAVGAAPPKTSKSLKASWSLHAVDTPGKYVVYPDTPGAQYSPVNVAATRPALVLQTAGLSYTSSNDGTAPLAYNALSPAEATMAIDALEGQDWLTSVHATPRVKAAAQAGTLHLGSWWDDFWNWLKDAAATVTHVVISVGEEIYLGIRAVVGTIENVFRTIIADIAEVANAIGSFFMQLGRLIEEIIEALSVLFQFGHIIDTHNILKTELLKRINGDGSTTYPGLTALVLGDKPKNITGVVSYVDSFFEQGEQAIGNALNGLANALGGSPVSDLKGSGSTAHSTLSVTPRGGGTTSSTATQGTWALNKFNGGIGSASAASTSAVGRLGVGDDPITAFFNTFAGRLNGDGDLTSQWSQVQQGAQGLGNTSSAADFVKQGLAELLRILALVLDGVLAVSNALLDGLLATITDFIQTMFAPDANGNPTSGGILTEPLDFPVLSWLYQLLFGEPLTILNALTLVIAIPVTIMWRIVEGQWPSESVGGTAAIRLGSAPPLLSRLIAYANGITTACLGFVFAAGDAEGDGDVPPLIGRAALAGSVLTSLFSIPSLSSDNPAGIDWAGWGVSLAIGLLNILGSHSFSASASFLLTYLGPALLSMLSIVQLFVLGVQFGVQPPPNVVGDAVLGIDMVALLPGMINPLKFASELLAAVVAVLDVVMGFAGAAAILISALTSQSMQHPS